MQQTQKFEAADLIWNHWQAGRQMEAIPESLRPVSREEGYSIQAALERLSRNGIAGWKIAATSKAGQHHIGVSRPLLGRLFQERIYPGNSPLSLNGNHMRVAEPEFAFRINVDLPPRANAYTDEEVASAIDTMHPAIEIPDSRFLDFASAGEAQLVADNACAHQFVLGQPSPKFWRTMDLAKHKTVVEKESGLMHNGIGENVLGGPLIALTWAINELRVLGITIFAGQVITTGTCAPPIPITNGDRIKADFGVLGVVSLAFES